MGQTLETYLSNCFHQNIIDHSIRANVNADGSVTFYIHPTGKDGDTLDFKVFGNELQPR